MKEDRLIVFKDNRLNAMRTMGMSLNERRLFSTYVSMLNPNDESKRCEVTFQIKDYLRMLGEKDKMSYTEVKETARRLRAANVEIDFGNRQWVTINLFSSITIDDGTITLETGGKAVDLLFGLKGNFTKYYLWNVLRLDSNSSFRIYELLKQYESIGSRTITVAALKEWIGISPDAYAVGFSAFRKYVLDYAKEELSSKTDISFTYTVEKAGRKIDRIHFIIIKNGNPVQVGMDEVLLEGMKQEQEISETSDFERAIANFSKIDMKMLQKAMKKESISEETVLLIVRTIQGAKSNVKDRTKLFWYCIHNGVSDSSTIEGIIKQPTSLKTARRDNFTQREYDDEFFEKITNATLSSKKA